MNSRRLFNVFEVYTGGVPHITSVKFIKMMKDATLLEQGFLQSDADIIFTKSKSKGQRTVNFDGFKKALEMVAAKKEVPSNDLAEFIIMKCGQGPRYTPLHDLANSAHILLHTTSHAYSYFNITSLSPAYCPCVRYTIAN
jgi:hypothetical protein